MKLLAFDIETSNDFDLKPGEDLDDYGPLQLSVAATASEGGEERHWFSVNAEGKPLTDMRPEKADELLRYLHQMQGKGYALCAWNGLGFDLKWIGHHAKNIDLARQIAQNLYDPMFQFFNQKGYPVSLASVGQGMKIPMKKLMASADAPQKWRAGEHQQVMDYVLGDTKMTLEVLRAILKQKEIRWVTQKGFLKSERMPTLKTVAEILQTPEPDQSWRDRPIPRSKFTGWLVR